MKPVSLVLELAVARQRADPQQNLPTDPSLTLLWESTQG